MRDKRLTEFALGYRHISIDSRKKYEGGRDILLFWKDRPQRNNIILIQTCFPVDWSEELRDDTS